MGAHMEPNVEPIKEILDELFSLLETFETQSMAITQFLKDQGIATDEKLAPYLDRAGNASSVKWRAARARMQYLLSPVQKEKKQSEGENPAGSEKKPDQAPQTASTEGSRPDSAKNAGTNEPPADAKNAKPSEPDKPKSSPKAKTAKSE
jgi:hypothetical protein